MRVLMLSKACIVGAYQRKLEELAARAPEMALVVAVPSSWKDKGGITRLELAHTRGYRLEVLPLAFNGQFHLHFYPTLSRLIREFRPDIVHIDEEPYNLATYLANRQARRYGAKTLWFSWQNLLRRYPPPFAWIEQYNLNHVDYAIAGSATAAEVWRRKGYSGSLAVIPQFGVDPDIFLPAATPSAGPPHIAYAGRLVPEKGTDLLLEALSGLDGPWRATIQGNGPEEAHLRALADQYDLTTRVTFCPPVPSVGMPAFYQSLDVLVLPSRTQENWTEQFGRVLVEAMACGVTVVGSGAGEIPHVVGDAGFIFPEGDVEALRAALARLIHDSALRRDLGTRGRARVLVQFTQQQVAEQTLQVYREMLA
ncbi:MAG: glycosyltransferase [Anaerolineae bacterium]|nr:glycosyltransferase [Anaerolineae bacterium]